MVKKEMLQVEICTEGGKIFLTQACFGHQEDNCICFSPEQIDIVIELLKEAKNELLSKQEE